MMKEKMAGKKKVIVTWSKGDEGQRKGPKGQKQERRLQTDWRVIKTIELHRRRL